MQNTEIAVVVIGRNEGERLKNCLRSIPYGLPVVYVDSGSSDGSLEFANAYGATGIALDMSKAFTAARARNAGWRALIGRGIEPEFIQFVDGDCEMELEWIPTATAALNAVGSLGVVFGRLKERFPEASLYNRMCDDEWSMEAGYVDSCGGIAVIRTKALQAVKGFSEDLIAGEEPDLCLRLRQQGWLIKCIAQPMAKHDANILSFRAWWRRTTRGGFGYADHVLRHGAQSIPQWKRQVKSILFWGFIWPLLGIFSTLMLIFISSQLIFGTLSVFLGAYLALFIKITTRRYRAGASASSAVRYAILIIVGKFAEFSGMVRCWIKKKLSRQARIIEYK